MFQFGNSTQAKRKRKNQSMKGWQPMQPDINYANDVDQSFHERPPVNLFDWGNIVFTNVVKHQQPDLSTESSGPWTSPEF